MSAHTPLTKAPETYLVDCNTVRKGVINLSPRSEREERLKYLRASIQTRVSQAEQELLSRKSLQRRQIRAQRRAVRSVAVQGAPASYAFKRMATSCVAVVIALMVAGTPLAHVFANELELEAAATEKVSEVVEVVAEEEVSVETDVVVEESTIDSVPEADVATEEIVEEDGEEAEDIQSFEEIVEEVVENVEPMPVQVLEDVQESEESTEEEVVEETEVGAEEQVVDVAQEEVADVESEEVAEELEAVEEQVQTAGEEPEVITPEDENETEEEVSAPVIELRGESHITITRGLGHTYSDLGAVALNAQGVTLSVTTLLDGEEVDEILIDTAQAGEYRITYVAFNGDISAEITRDVSVVDAQDTVDVEDGGESAEQSEIEASQEEDTITDVVDNETTDVPEMQQQEVGESEEVDTQAMRAEIREELFEEVRSAVTAELKENCIEFTDGSYYCMNTESEIETTAADNTAVAFTKKDAQGNDDEIFITRDGTQMRITNNEVDDRFPQADLFGTWIVWQTQKDSFWQIAAYNMRTDETFTLTDESRNHMNPQVYKDVVVWQGWVDDNWEIFVGTYTGGSWHTQQITFNDWHDVFPSAALGLITWQSHEGGVWSVKMHDVESGSTSQLSQGAKKYENPRFALIWDERDANGDVAVFEYDLSSGDAERFRRSNTDDDTTPETPVDPVASMPARVDTAPIQLSKDDESEGE